MLCFLYHAAELLSVKQRRHFAKQSPARFLFLASIPKKLHKLLQFHNRVGPLYRVFFVR